MSDDTGLPGNDNTNTPPAAPEAPATPPDWKTQLGDLASNDRVKGFSSVKELAEAYVASPTPTKLPESHEGYKLPENVKIKGLRKMALENKLSQGQLDGILKFNSDAVKRNKEEVKSLREQAITTLKSEWGDKYESNMKSAVQTLATLDKDKEMFKFLQATGMDNDPRIIKFLHRVSGSIGEGGFVGSDGNVKNKKKSRAEVLFPNHPSG